MWYRSLGSTGLQVSEVSTGSWITYSSEIAAEQARAALPWTLQHPEVASTRVGVSKPAQEHAEVAASPRVRWLDGTASGAVRP